MTENNDDDATWVERNAARIARALADPATRARVLALLEGHERDRARRREAARAELADVEITWRLEDEEDADP